MNMRICGIVVAALLVIGCTPDDKMSEVSGKVTFQGKPLENGAISFFPTGGDTPTAGGVITNGIYSTRVPRGEMKVTISAVKIVGKKPAYDAPNSPIMDITEEALPAKYNAQSELRLDVQPGVNKKDWELTE